MLSRIVTIVLMVLIAACSPEPAADGFVDDRAGLLTVAERGRIDAFHRKLLTDLDIHLQLVTLDQSPSDLNRTALDLFKQHALGDATRGARGVLLLVDPGGQQVRLEIGYDLEGVFPDGFVGNVERRQMVPFFQVGRVGAGIEATVELLVGRALGAGDEVGSAGNRGELSHLSGGAGARAEVEIGAGIPVLDEEIAPGTYAAQSSPLETLQLYGEVVGRHLKSPDLGLYTPETRDFFRQWLVTDAQQDNELRTLDEMLPQAAVIEHGERAVVRFPVTARRAAPYLLRRGPTGWQLDFAAMSRLIGFNHKNQWFFRSSGHEFMFGFTDLDFDRHGFPHSQQ